VSAGNRTGQPTAKIDSLETVIRVYNCGFRTRAAIRRMNPSGGIFRFVTASRLLGEARFFRNAGGDEAEMALAVAEDCRGQGVADRLMQNLGRRRQSLRRATAAARGGTMPRSSRDKSWSKSPLICISTPPRRG
jgi:GNAT superfamily N-acetyltransferase